MTEKKINDVKAPRRAVFAFGRFQPPTKGHLKIVDAVNEHAKEIRGDGMIFVSQTQDKKGRNPLAYREKADLMKQLMPSANIIIDEKVKTAWNVLEKLDEMDYTEVYLVCGSDRMEEYTKRWLPYAEETFEKAGIVSAGFRDPDDEKSAAGMSGTKAREAAEIGDIGKFRAATGWSGELADALMHAVKKGLPGGPL